jgi:enoyl-ACP reductase-like protein
MRRDAQRQDGGRVDFVCDLVLHARRSLDTCAGPTCRTARPTSIKTPSRDSERQSSGPDRRKRAGSQPCGGVLDSKGNIRDTRASTRLRLQPACLRRCHQQRSTRLHRELAGSGVTSNGIMPGLIYPPQLNKWLIETAQRQGSDVPEFGKRYALKNIIRQTVSRLGQPIDIAAAACFLASPLTDFMTGTTFRIDGGSTPTV